MAFRLFSKQLNQGLSVLLALSLLLSMLPVRALAVEEGDSDIATPSVEITLQTPEDPGAEGEEKPTEGTDENAGEGSGAEADEAAEDAEMTAGEDALAEAEEEAGTEKAFSAESYRDGYIFIHHFTQLCAVGSGKPITVSDHLEEEFSQGDLVWLNQEETARYSLDGTYVLMGDIPFPDGQVWTLPEGFCGVFLPLEDLAPDPAAEELPAQEPAGEDAPGEPEAPEEAEPEPEDLAAPEEPVVPEESPVPENSGDARQPTASEEAAESALEGAEQAETELCQLTEPQGEETAARAGEETPDGEQAPEGDGEESGAAPRLYDPEGDIIFLYHPYQLEILLDESREEQPVMSLDYDAASFGMGSFLFPDGEEGPYLTYSGGHHYVLSASFHAEKPALKSAALLRGGAKAPAAVTDNSAHVDGRDYFGQTSVEINGTTYILIGDRQQLDAINLDNTIRTKVSTAVYKATEGAVEVWRTNAHLTGDWIWLSEFDGTKDLKDGNGYGSTAEEVKASYQALASGAEIIYPGDADLIGDFSTSPLYGVNSGGYHKLDRPGLTATGRNSTRDVYFTNNPSTGLPDITTATLVASDPDDGTLRYEKNGNYIVFRDIDMRVHDGEDMRNSTDISDSPAWKPLMFSGNMYGISSPGDAVGTLKTEILPVIEGTDAAHAVAVTRRPTISYVNVVPAEKVQLSERRLDLNVQTGVGFFGTLQGDFSSSSLIQRPMAVKNIRLDLCRVENQTVTTQIDATLVQGLLTGLGWALETVLSPLLKLLVDEDASVNGLLTSLLNTRQKDPTSLATGAFAGRIIGDTTVQYCEVDRAQVITVQTKFEQGSAFDSNKQMIVGKGGFLGSAEGTTQYEGLSSLLGGVVNALAAVLNLIPGVGLGDLITLLLKNAANLGQLIPTGYASPQIRDCTVRRTALSAEEGKLGVGGFAGSLCGTELTDCAVVDCNAADADDDLRVNAASFGGGFSGVARDAFIGQTLSGLGIDIGSLHPQTVFLRCGIQNSTVHVNGGSYLGGFVGSQNNSYAINCDVDANSVLDISATGDYVGGFTGQAHLGTSIGLGDFLQTEGSLTNTLKGLVTGLLGSGSGQALLELGGVAPSAIMGCQIHGPLSVESEGGFVGGLVGRGNGVIISRSSAAYLRQLAKYNKKSSGAWRLSLPISEAASRDNRIDQLVSVRAGEATATQYDGESFAGGLAGYLTSANVGGLLGDTAGVAEYLGYTVCDTTVTGIGSGYSVYAEKDIAAGGVGWAVGGDIYDVELRNLGSVQAANHAGGFVGITGPGDLVSGNGLDVTLLGITLVSVDNLLSVASGVKSTFTRANVTGIDAGFTVLERDRNHSGGKTTYAAGGYASVANSVTITDCHVDKLNWVKANMQDGLAAGFVGSSSAGGLAGLIEDGSTTLNVAQINGLLGAIPYLIPKYNGCDVSYVNGGYIEGDTAGGFAAEFQSGLVNTETVDSGAAQSYQKYPDGAYPDDDPDHSEYAAEAAATVAYTVGVPNDPYSVRNIDHVRGGSYAGGWGGNVYSGSLASAGSGLSLLGGHGNVGSVDLIQLLNLVEAYVPIIKYAGVNSYDPANGNNGFTVYAAHDFKDDPADPDAPATEGYAGGFIGYGSGVQVSYSDVNKLRNGEPTPPTAFTAQDNTAYARFGLWPDELEAQNGGSYMSFNNSPEAIPYAVAGAHYAGGYIGHMDIGSAASLGKGLSLLGDVVDLGNVLDALNVVVSTVEHSDVYGAPGGFSVIASPRINLHSGSFGDASGLGIAHAGGFAGRISGGHIQDSNVNNFYYIIGEVSAGGYAGEAVPGDAASVLGEGDVLSKLANVSSLASLVQDFVPTIRNSETNCVPCGGAVRAECFSDSLVVRGMAGGYVGHCKGAQIWGMSNDRWKDENDGSGNYTGPQRECAAIRIRSVYGAEYAGGYCGMMEPGSTAETGGLSLLGGLLDVNNVLSALQIAYPTIKRGAVYGPLRKVDEDTWNAWVKYVGSHGSFYPELARASYADLDQFVYGTHVVAGRHELDPSANTILGGCAGGFVGAMHSGVIRHSKAEDAKLVCAMRSSGGFAGEMLTKGAAKFGSVSLLGGLIPLEVGNLLQAAEVLVPAISNSGTTAYRQGLTVQAVGERNPNGVGCAGGYVGACYGGQIGRNYHDAPEPVWVRGLKTVYGTNCIGGFIGKSGSGSVLNANTNDVSAGLLQGLLDSIISTPASLLGLVNATMTTIKHAEVTSSDDAWGIVVGKEFLNDLGETDYADYAGGFAGSLEASVLGERKNAADTLTVSKLRSVTGGYYAGGFFGLADVTSVANVGSGSGTTLLSLLELGSTSLLDAFRSYIYHADVTGVDDGITVLAHKWGQKGTQNMVQVSGGAGGFGGGLMNGTVENSAVTKLSYIEGPNYAAGFIAQMGKSGILDLDKLHVLDDSLIGLVLSAAGLNLTAAAQLLSIVGSTVKSCEAEGIDRGFVARVTQLQSPQNNQNEDEAYLTGACAGGFTGFADIAQIEDSHVSKLKYVQSSQIAAGFIGRSSAAYLAEVDLNTELVNTLLNVLSPLLDILRGLSSVNLIDLSQWELLGVQLLADGNLVWLNLFGLEIGVSFMENDPEFGGSTDSLTITLGSSTIKLPYDKVSGTFDSTAPNASINLIEGNRTSVKNCTVTGIDQGYDVFGGGASQQDDGTENAFGYAGGFVGYNKMGYFSHDRMWLCDVVRGYPGLVGPFVGGTLPGSRGQAYLEGNDNNYSIYRTRNEDLDHVETGGLLSRSFGSRAYDSAGGIDYNRYDVLHYQIIQEHSDLHGAQQKGTGSSADLDAWASDAKAVLMLDTPLLPNGESETIAPDELKDPCAERFDLHIHKKWRDYNNLLHTRPSSIEIELLAVDVGRTPRAQLIQSIFPESDWNIVNAQLGIPQTLTMTGNIAEDGTIHWSLDVEDLPVAYVPTDEHGDPLQRQKLDEHGNPLQQPKLDEHGDPVLDEHGDPVMEPVMEPDVHYLQYVVTEKYVENYKVPQVQILEDTASVIITNELDGVILPGMGGAGTSLYMLAGIPLFICGMTLFYIMSKKRRKEVLNE